MTTASLGRVILLWPVGDPKITIFDSETGLIGELGFDE